MIEALIGSGVTLLLIGAAIFFGHRLIRRYLDGNIEIQRRAMALKEERQRVELRERQTQAEVDAQNVDELAALRQAELVRDTAAAEQAAHLASDPELLASRKQAEIDIIAAQRDARIAAAPQDTASTRADVLEQLMGNYRFYVDRLEAGEEIPTFDDWLGNLRKLLD